jgi:hypothetical protein
MSNLSSYRTSRLIRCRYWFATIKLMQVPEANGVIVDKGSASRLSAFRIVHIRYETPYKKRASFRILTRCRACESLDLFFLPSGPLRDSSGLVVVRIFSRALSRGVSRESPSGLIRNCRLPELSRFCHRVICPVAETSNLNGTGQAVYSIRLVKVTSTIVLGLIGLGPVTRSIAARMSILAQFRTRPN